MWSKEVQDKELQEKRPKARFLIKITYIGSLEDPLNFALEFCRAIFLSRSKPKSAYFFSLLAQLPYTLNPFLLEETLSTLNFMLVLTSVLTAYKENFYFINFSF